MSFALNRGWPLGMVGSLGNQSMPVIFTVRVWLPLRVSVQIAQDLAALAVQFTGGVARLNELIGPLTIQSYIPSV